VIKLNEVNTGQKAVVADVCGDSRFLSRIVSIGLTPGCKIEMLHNEGNLPLLFYGRDTVIALNREESKDIAVEVVA